MRAEQGREGGREEQDRESTSTCVNVDMYHRCVPSECVHEEGSGGQRKILGWRFIFGNLTPVHSIFKTGPAIEFGRWQKLEN